MAEDMITEDITLITDTDSPETDRFQSISLEECASGSNLASQPTQIQNASTNLNTIEQSDRPTTRPSTRINELKGDEVVTLNPPTNMSSSVTTSVESIKESSPNLSANSPLSICTSYTDAEIDQLPPAARKLLERLQFKNPGKKQLEYKKFNPEMSERERKKLRRFQGTAKIRQGIYYSEEGILVVDDRNLCDCLDATCPGCFYPCPQCKSIKCGPVCRCNRRWVYDYVEDEQRTYHLEFPEAFTM